MKINYTPGKVANTYLLNRTVIPKFERAAIRRIVNFLCRLTAVIGFVAFIGIWAGMESGPLLIGWRLLWTAAALIWIALAFYGENKSN